MASGSVPEFKTLKECLQFLEWLRTDKQGQLMQSQVANRLMRILEKMYRNRTQSNIEFALSTFLNHVSTFYTKVCNKTQGVYTGKTTAKNVLNALLNCIPKVLAAIYFLRYNVDPDFAALGGGQWKDQSPGWAARYAAIHMPPVPGQSKIDDYLIANVDEQKYGVVPGGFDPSELTPIHQSNYSPGKNMVTDLKNILEKYSHRPDIQNYFLDVFCTTVFSTSGFDTANIANSLRLVQDFCTIFEKITSDQDFRNHLYAKDRCIDLNDLRNHCAKLKGPLAKIFTPTAFSFTGYARQPRLLITENIAKKMASWFKKNLLKVLEHLRKIQFFTSIVKFSSKQLRRGAKILPEQSKALEKYFIGNFFRYGFTFHGNKYTNKSAPYEILEKDWTNAIGELNHAHDGLAKLKEILDGKECPNIKPEEDEESKEEPEDVELVGETFVPVTPPNKQDVPPAKVPEVPKEVVPEAKSEGAQNQGKKAEGAQNQGKKAEGAQNQGKKAEGSSTNSSLQSVPTQSSSVSSSDASSSGVAGPSSGRGPVDQAATSGAGQSGSKEVQSSSGDSNTRSSAGPGDGSGAGGDGGRSNGGSGVPGQAGKNAHDTETDKQKPLRICGPNESPIDRRRNYVCYRKPPPPSTRVFGDKTLTEIMEEVQRRLDDDKKLRSDHDMYVQQMDQMPNYSHALNGSEVSAPFDGKVLPDTDLIRRQQQRDYNKSLMSKLGVSGDTIPAPISAPLPQVPTFYAGPIGQAIEAPQPQMVSLPQYPPIEFVGRHVTYPKLENNWPLPPPMQKSTDHPTEPIKSNPPIPDLDSNLLRTQQLSVGGSRIPTTQLPGIPNIEINLPVDTNGRTIFDPKKHHSSPSKLISKLPKISAVATTTKIPHEVIPVFLGDINRWASEASGQHILDPNVGRRMPPLPTSKPTVQHGHTSIKSPITAALGNHDMDSLTNITISDIKSTPKTIAQVSPLYAMATGYPLKPPKTPSTSEIHLLPAPKPLMKPIRMKPTGIAMPEYKHPPLIPHAPIITDTFDDPSMDKLLYAPSISMARPLRSDVDIPAVQHITPPTPPMPDFNGTIVPDSNLDSNIPKVYLEHPPPIRFEMKKAHKQRKTPDPFEIDIHVPKLKLPDNDLDFELDFDDDSTHIKTETLLDPVDPPFPAVSFNIAPPDVEQSLPPPEDFDPEIIHRPEITMCVSSWATSTPTPGSTDIPETELFPSQAPRTVRDTLTWLAGLRNPKHHDTLKQCIKRAFGGSQDDPSQLALSINHANILPDHVFDILQLTAMFAGSVLTSIAPNWKAHASSRTMTTKSTTQSDEPVCCALLCQLRDYAYACHHQLQFMKAQCNRDELHGGWKHDKYGSDITPSKSPLQTFLTDGWDSTFETHLFDPCNLCHKSRVKMGFSKKDLPEKSHDGSTLSTILTPSCGGDDVREGVMVTSPLM